MNYLNRGKGATMAQQVYKGIGQRQVNAAANYKPNRSSRGETTIPGHTASAYANLLDAQATTIRKNVGMLPSTTLMTTTTIRANPMTGRPNQVTIEDNGQEMIELSDGSDDMDIDYDAIKEAMDVPSPP